VSFPAAINATRGDRLVVVFDIDTVKTTPPERGAALRRDVPNILALIECLGVLPLVEDDENRTVRVTWVPDVPGGTLERIKDGLTFGVGGDDVIPTTQVVDAFNEAMGPTIGLVGVSFVSVDVQRGDEDTTPLLSRVLGNVGAGIGEGAAEIGKGAFKLTAPLVLLVVGGLVVLLYAVGKSGARAGVGPVGVG
jgi:hypothetical protein